MDSDRVWQPRYRTRGGRPRRAYAGRGPGFQRALFVEPRESGGRDEEVFQREEGREVRQITQHTVSEVLNVFRKRLTICARPSANAGRKISSYISDGRLGTKRRDFVATVVQ